MMFMRCRRGGVTHKPWPEGFVRDRRREWGGGAVAGVQWEEGWEKRRQAGDGKLKGCIHVMPCCARLPKKGVEAAQPRGTASFQKVAAARCGGEAFSARQCSFVGACGRNPCVCSARRWRHGRSAPERSHAAGEVQAAGACAMARPRVRG